MNEMMDQLEQVIEERVMQLKGKMEEEKVRPIKPKRRSISCMWPFRGREGVAG